MQKNRRLNLLALCTIVLGSASLVTPASARADDVVCCPGAAGSCCGRKCQSTNDGTCEACSSWWSCLWL